MQKAKEVLLEMLKDGGKPERILKQYEAFEMCLGDPVMMSSKKYDIDEETYVDSWGITFTMPKGMPGRMPVTSEDKLVCKDITKWKDCVKAPDIEKTRNEDWSGFSGFCRQNAGDEKLITAFMGTGMFEQCHYLMGFENTLTAMYEHPEELHEMIDYICDYRIRYASILIDKLEPDVLFTHDDWGTKDALFMSPEMWREFFKEPYRRFYGFIKSKGCITVHHADSFLAPIVEDMAEIGIDMWQGVLPENDIPELQKRLQGSMILMGGVGAAIDRPDSEEKEIREYVAKVLTECCPGGAFIPCITYGLSGTIYPHVDPFINDEIDKYNEKLIRENARIEARRARAQKKESQNSESASVEGSGNILEEIAEALRKCRKKKLIELCRQALDSGIDAQSILSEGLVLGMSRLGDDFEQSKAFVSELLMASKCMNAATDILKPLLTGNVSSAKGKIVLGSVKGDLHDIGKNLVKIMMEGRGLTVIDLGADVEPQKFVDAAAAENADIIACSALLTTTMASMREVARLRDEAGLKGKVKLLIGGAPITGEFSKEIGADAYTSNAAEAASLAVRLLS